MTVRFQNRVTIHPGPYHEGRAARQQGLDLSANPHKEFGEDRMSFFLGYYDEAHGVTVEQRATHPYWQDDTDAPADVITARIGHLQ